MTEPRTPHELAQDWMTRIADDLETRVLPEPSGTYRAVLHGPHPFADDVPVRVTFVGGDRAAAIAGARSQLLALARRAFAQPSIHSARAADAREAHVYTPTAKSMRRVVRALEARGHRTADNREIQRAHLALKIDRGHDDHLICELVDEVLAGRVRLSAALADRRVRDPRQPALL